MNKQFVPAFSYDFLTPFYDCILNIIGFGTKQREKIVDLLNLKSGEKLLDVGCGTGSFLLVAKRKFPNVIMTGVDIDEKVLNIAKKKIQNSNLDVTLINTGGQELPFNDSSFEVVVSTLIFHHLPRDVKKKVLKEIYRVLKKNGRFLLVDFGKLDGFLKIGFQIEVLLNIPEHKTAKDNVEGKIPGFIQDTGFELKEVAPRYRGIQYILARK